MDGRRFGIPAGHGGHRSGSADEPEPTVDHGSAANPENPGEVAENPENPDEIASNPETTWRWRAGRPTRR